MGSPLRVPSPAAGLWRVGRIRPSSTLSRDLGSLDPVDTAGGNRYDSTNGAFQVSYLGTTLEACFGEVLAPLRPDPELAALVLHDWRKLNCMEIGGIPADWRDRRQATQVVLGRQHRFFDVESVEAMQVLRYEIGVEIKQLGHPDIDVSTIRGPDRRATRLISDWVHAQTTPAGHPAFAGICYRSRLNTDWECWAVFDRTHLRPVGTPSAITADMPELKSVARRFHLRVF